MAKININYDHNDLFKNNTFYLTFIHQLFTLKLKQTTIPKQVCITFHNYNDLFNIYHLKYNNAQNFIQYVARKRLSENSFGLENLV